MEIFETIPAVIERITTSIIAPKGTNTDHFQTHNKSVMDGANAI